MRRDPKAFRERFNAWKNGQQVYQGGRPTELPGYEEGKDTKRQIFWVIRTNENAIKRYKHYGFNEENMFDYVMQYN